MRSRYSSISSRAETSPAADHGRPGGRRPAKARSTASIGPGRLYGAAAHAVGGRRACCDLRPRRRARTPSGAPPLWLHDELRSRGHEAWVETHWVRPQRGGGASRSAACWPWPAACWPTAAPVAGLALAVAGALMLAVEAAGFVPPAVPRRATQDVLTEAHERGAHARHRGRLRRAEGPVAAPAAAALGRWRPAPLPSRERRRARLGGIDATWLGAVQLVPTVVLLVAFAAAVDMALSAVPARQRIRRGGRHRPVRRAVSRAAALARALAAAVRRRACGLAVRAPRASRSRAGADGGGPPAWSAGHPAAPRRSRARRRGGLGYQGGGRAAGVRITRWRRPRSISRSASSTRSTPSSAQPHPPRRDVRDARAER